MKVEVRINSEIIDKCAMYSKSVLHRKALLSFKDTIICTDTAYSKVFALLYEISRLVAVFILRVSV